MKLLGNISMEPAVTSSAAPATCPQRRQKRGQPCPCDKATACDSPAVNRNRLTMALRCQVQNGSWWKSARMKPKWSRSKQKWNTVIHSMAVARSRSMRSRRPGTMFPLDIPASGGRTVVNRQQQLRQIARRAHHRVVPGGHFVHGPARFAAHALARRRDGGQRWVGAVDEAV